MLDRLDDAFARQREFVSDASHELRSPLTAIRGQLEVLAREESPSAEEVRRVERVAMTEIRRVERLVEDLLTLARFDEGVGPAARRDRGRPRSSAASPTRERRAVAVGRLPRAASRADPDLIAQVVRNLLANARRHAGPEGRVVALLDGPAAGELIVAVDDDGPGIPPAERERVFDRFHRSEPLARPGLRAGAGSASASRARSSRRTAAGSGSRTRRSAAPGSPSPCPASRRR